MPYGFFMASGSPLHLNFGQTRLSRADSVKGARQFQQEGKFAKGKVTKREAPLATAPKLNFAVAQRPFTFPIRRSIPWRGI
jgi:hypothetical protein